MYVADWTSLIFYLSFACVIYLIPLAFSKRAKSSANGAALIVGCTMAVVFVLAGSLYLVGAGLVGPLSLGGFLQTTLFYVAPGFLVLLVWFLGLQLIRPTKR